MLSSPKSTELRRFGREERDRGSAFPEKRRTRRGGGPKRVGPEEVRTGGGRRAKSASVWDMGTPFSVVRGASMGKGRAPQGGKPGNWRRRPDRRTGWVRSTPADRLGPQPPAGRPGDPPPAETSPHPQGHPLVSLARCTAWSWGAALTSAARRLVPRPPA